MRKSIYLRTKVAILAVFITLLSGIVTKSQAQNIEVVGNNLIYLLVDGEATLEGFYDDEESTLTVPDAITYNGKTYPVTVIASASFNSCPLTSVTFGANVRSVENRAFGNNKQLTSVKLNDKLQRISTEVFMNCTKLEEIALPAGLNEISGNTFRGCTLLKKVTVALANPNFTTIDNAVVSKNKEVLVVVSPAIGVDSVYTVPTGIKELAGSVFLDAPFKEIILPESLQTIGEKAFGKSSIKTLTIPAGVTKIGEAFIYNTNSLQSVTLASGNNNFEINGTFFIEKSTNVLLGITTPFMDTELTIPEGIKKVGGFIFNAAANLTTVNLPSSLIETGEQSFSSCPALATVNLKEGIQKIGRLSFFNNKKLVNFNFPSTLKELDYQAFASVNGLTTAILPEGLEILGDGALRSISTLKEVYIPKSLKYFGDSMFSFCTSLEKINALPEWLEELPQATFSNCGKITNVTIPKGVKTIGNSAFYGTALTSVELPEALEYIDRIAFYQTKITELNIPDKVTFLGYHAFGWCPELKTVKLGKSVQTVDALCFNNCVKIEKLELNEGLDSIGDRAFCKTEILKSVVLPSTLKRIGQRAFLNTGLMSVHAMMKDPTPIKDEQYVFSTTENKISTSDCPRMTLHVLSGSLDAYKEAPVWKTFGTILGDAASVDELTTDQENITIKDIYDVQGNRHNEFVKGLNIVRYSNGNVRKIFVK